MKRVGCNGDFLHILFFGQRFQAGYSSKQTKVGRQCYWAVSDVMDSLFAFFSAVRANFGWLQLHPKIRRHPFLDLEYRAKVWSHPPQCLSLLAKVVLSPETCQSGPQICSGKSAHKTSLRVAGKNWCITSWDPQLTFAKENAIWNCKSPSKNWWIEKGFLGQMCLEKGRKRGRLINSRLAQLAVSWPAR